MAEAEDKHGDKAEAPKEEASSSSSSGVVKKASASSSSSGAVKKVVKSLDEAETEEEVVAHFEAKKKARRKARQKRMQYQFMFKAGAFLVMLTVVMITKKVQEWYKPTGTNSTLTTTNVITQSGVPETNSHVDPKGEL
eukprot:TRINITY_DN67966_c0_g1_i1.p1 TRINITY_DN67966_c0_g1~~TRINITY_DN67966_c0_g1_i1.p1  ORF type:complete len:138 (-),score=38.86 TRINITY_DN67966_c0_g1_i1:82-495(-)